MLWVGVEGEMEEQLVPRAGLTLKRIKGGPIAGVSRLTQLKNLAHLAGSVWRSWRLIGAFQPQVVFLTGGYMSVPVALAAWLRRIPALVYLPDLEPGAAVRLIARLVTLVAATFAESAAYFSSRVHLVATGYPLRPEMVAAAKMKKSEARAAFQLTGDGPTLLVFGGSRGAWSINQALMAILSDLPAELEIIHVTGQLTWELVEEFTRSLPADLRARYRPFPYLHEEMGAAFRAADLVVARAGASMLGEAPLFGLPAILVPYPYAWRYQKVNADYLSERGAAIRLNDDYLQDQLLPTIEQLLRDKERLESMRAAALKLHQPDAARRLAEAVLRLGNQQPSHPVPTMNA